ncbi:MAG: WXG100 family type VII secretion target [Actinobacteria bacterium]|nr:WXG100 family type VII secretion target [Actinomycetota bacterium]MBI3688469.1 WXG100 family type VII secretion target [Actinomycetota bacterium]
MYWFERLLAQQALERDQNPIVGDPDRIAALAAQLSSTAETLRTQNQRLRGITADQFWQGAAATRFTTTKAALPPMLDQVIERYTAVGRTLATYHPQLREARHLAAKALADYRMATHQLRIADDHARRRVEAESRVHLGARHVHWTGPDPVQQQALASEQVQAAVRLMATAIENRDRAAHVAAVRIHQAVHDDLANDVWLRQAIPALTAPLVGALTRLAPLLRAVSGWLSLLALALAGVPGGGPASRTPSSPGAVTAAVGVPVLAAVAAARARATGGFATQDPELAAAVRRITLPVAPSDA